MTPLLCYDMEKTSLILEEQQKQTDPKNNNDRRKPNIKTTKAKTKEL